MKCAVATDLVRLLGNGADRLLLARDVPGEEGKTFASEVAHGDATERHEDQHAVHEHVSGLAGEMFPRWAREGSWDFGRQAKSNAGDRKSSHQNSE